MINYNALIEDFPEYINNIKPKDPVLFGLFINGKHIVLAESKNFWRSRSAASSAINNIVGEYLYNKNIGSLLNHYDKRELVVKFKKMLLASGVVEIKEIG
jgi:hypothetical protein